MVVLVLCGSDELVTTVWHKFDRMIIMIITDCDQALWHALMQNSTVVFETPYCIVIDQPLSAGSTKMGYLLEQINLVSMVLVSQARPTCTSPQIALSIQTRGRVWKHLLGFHVLVKCIREVARKICPLNRLRSITTPSDAHVHMHTIFHPYPHILSHRFCPHL